MWPLAIHFWRIEAAARSSIPYVVNTQGEIATVVSEFGAAPTRLATRSMLE